MENGNPGRLRNGGHRTSFCSTGSYHEWTASEMAFKIAGSMAFKARLRPGSSGTARADHAWWKCLRRKSTLAQVFGDLHLSDRCQIQGTESRGGANVIRVEVPLAEMLLGMPPMCAAARRAVPAFSMHFSHYAEAPAFSCRGSDRGINRQGELASGPKITIPAGCKRTYELRSRQQQWRRKNSRRKQAAP